MEACINIAVVPDRVDQPSRLFTVAVRKTVTEGFGTAQRLHIQSIVLPLSLFHWRFGREMSLTRLITTSGVPRELLITSCAVSLFPRDRKPSSTLNFFAHQTGSLIPAVELFQQVLADSAGEVLCNARTADLHIENTPFPETVQEIRERAARLAVVEAKVEGVGEP